MKKTLIFGLIVASLGFTACNKENAIPADNSQTKEMMLNATVEQPAETRATINGSATDWQFAFAENDVIKVNNSTLTSGIYYNFTNDGSKFKCPEAKAAESAVNWYAYFPSNTIDLTGQNGTLAGAANLYALTGATASATTGAEGLNITMAPKVAILKIDNQKGAMNIQVKTSASDFVKGLSAKNNAAGYDVTTSTTATSLFSTSDKGTYYIVVPAGKQISVKNGSTTIKSTGTSGLAGGKYYDLSVKQPVTSISLNTTSKDMSVNETFTLTATVKPDDATDKSVTWSCNNSNATVNQSGLVTAKAAGTAVITATANDGSGVEATCNLTIAPVLVSSIQLTPSRTNWNTLGTFTLAATVLPSNAANKALSWSCDNTSKITIQSSGNTSCSLYLNRTSGTATITCTAQDGSGVKATFTVPAR